MTLRTGFFLSLTLLLGVPACYRDPYLRYQERVSFYMEPPESDVAYYDPPVVSAPLPPPVMTDLGAAYPPVVMDSVPVAPPASWRHVYPCSDSSCLECNGLPASSFVGVVVIPSGTRGHPAPRHPGFNGPRGSVRPRTPPPAAQPCPGQPRPGPGPGIQRPHDPPMRPRGGERPPALGTQPDNRVQRPRAGQPPAGAARPRGPSPEPPKVQPPKVQPPRAAITARSGPKPGK